MKGELALGIRSQMDAVCPEHARLRVEGVDADPVARDLSLLVAVFDVEPLLLVYRPEYVARNGAHGKPFVYLKKLNQR